MSSLAAPAAWLAGVAPGRQRTLVLPGWRGVRFAVRLRALLSDGKTTQNIGKMRLVARWGLCGAELPACQMGKPHRRDKVCGRRRPILVTAKPVGSIR